MTVLWGSLPSLHTCFEEPGESIPTSPQVSVAEYTVCGFSLALTLEGNWPYCSFNKYMSTFYFFLVNGKPEDGQSHQNDAMPNEGLPT